MNITITKQHLEEMKKKLSERFKRIYFRWQEEVEAEMWCPFEADYVYEITQIDVWRELQITMKFCSDIDWYIETSNDEFEVDSSDWFIEWRLVNRIDDAEFDQYYMFPKYTEREKMITMRHAAMFNKNIKIYRSDVEKMRKAICQRLSDFWDEYSTDAELEELYSFVGISAQEAMGELCRTNCLCDKIDSLLVDESFDFIYVDADKWFNEWNIDECLVEGIIDEYYMLPNSDEVDEIFCAMKANYKYTVEDLFGFYRFYPLDENTVVA